MKVRTSLRSAHRRNGPFVRRPSLRARSKGGETGPLHPRLAGRPARRRSGDSRPEMVRKRAYDDLLVLVVPEEVQAKAETWIPGVASFQVQV